MLFLSVPWMLPLLSVLVAAAPTASSNNSFDLYQHFGNLGPYYKPSNTPESLLSGVPTGCTVDKAFLVHRHGSRQPLSDELPVMQNLSYYINNNTDLFSKPATPVPSEFAFLTSGWEADFIINNLSVIGRQQCFDHGVTLKIKYPQLYTTDVLAGKQDRVVESAQWFMDGYYGRYANTTANLDLINEDNKTVSWITPFDTCAAWKYSYGSNLVAEWGKVYLPPIAARINSLLSASYPGVNFTAANVHGMFYACVYGTAVYGEGSSPWCDVFTDDEILLNEYEYDLLMRGAFGYGLPNGMGPVLGSLLVSNVTTFMQQTNTNLSLNFGHDTTIDISLSALGLAYDAIYPADGPPNPDRAWRTSRQVSFAAQMLWTGLSCTGGEQRIQLLMNEANFDLGPTGCDSDEYGTCSFDDFLDASTVQKALNITQGDPTWNAVCST